MMQLPFQFQIAPCKKACVACNRSFTNGEMFISSFNPADWERKDRCEKCFSGIPEAVFWRSPFRNHKAAKEILLPLEAEYRLLKELLAKEEFQEAFVLALYLQRKKTLALRKDNVDGKFLFEHLESGEMVLVPRVSLSSLPLPKILEKLKGSK